MTEEQLTVIEAVYGLAIERASQTDDVKRKKQLCAAVLNSETALMEFIKEHSEKKDK